MVTPTWPQCFSIVLTKSIWSKYHKTEPSSSFWYFVLQTFMYFLINKIKNQVKLSSDSYFEKGGQGSPLWGGSPVQQRSQGAKHLRQEVLTQPDIPQPTTPLQAPPSPGCHHTIPTVHATCFVPLFS
jgi:hypothetical protein